MTADGMGMMGEEDEIAIDFDAAPSGPLCCTTVGEDDPPNVSPC